MMSLLRNAHVIGLCLVIELANCGGSFAQSAQTTASPSNNQELNGKIELLTRSLEQTQFAGRLGLAERQGRGTAADEGGERL